MSEVDSLYHLWNICFHNQCCINHHIKNNQNTISFKNLYFYIENNFLMKISSLEADKLDKNINMIAHEYCT